MRTTHLRPIITITIATTLMQTMMPIRIAASFHRVKKASCRRCRCRLTFVVNTLIAWPVRDFTNISAITVNVIVAWTTSVVSTVERGSRRSIASMRKRDERARCVVVSVEHLILITSQTTRSRLLRIRLAAVEERAVVLEVDHARSKAAADASIPRAADGARVQYTDEARSARLR